MAPESRAFPRPLRLTRGTDLERVRHEGKRVRTASLDVRATASLHALSRVGFVVPKYKHSGVARNLVKRRLRELVRLRMLGLLQEHPPLDVVVRVFPSAYDRDFAVLGAELEQAIRQLLKRVG
ncbi:ribonuclease P protein component [Gemmatimonas sp.]|uniref:ribonuclease P protein component n=1 Tax=Gemmatimonas sp. TaxID=1962908 RepID=UPI0037C1B3DE